MYAYFHSQHGSGNKMHYCDKYSEILNNLILSRWRKDSMAFRKVFYYIFPNRSATWLTGSPITL